MEVFCVADPGEGNGLYPELKAEITRSIKKSGHNLELFELERNSVAPCLGCFYCFTKHPGKCVSRDMIPELKIKARNCDAIILLTPVLFGNFTSPVKNTIDRGLTAELGIKKKFPPQYIIGYSGDITSEERNTFIDITRLHMGHADIVHPEFKKMHVESFVTGSKNEIYDVCGKIEKLL